MPKRKTKRNARRSQAGRGFKIWKNPVVHVANDGLPPDVQDQIGLSRVHGQSCLFAIARDARTIFVSWNIDWRSVFERGIPADRQVHLRVIGEDGVIEKRVAVEPMTLMHYLTTSALHKAYRVEIGYVQPLDIWHSVAVSNEVVMPPERSVERTAVEVATIPFHLSFQHMANLFDTPDNHSVARIISQFQKRVINNATPNEATRSDTQVLRSLNLSVPEIATAVRNFKNINTEKLARRSRVMFEFAATSPVCGFQPNVGS